MELQSATREGLDVKVISLVIGGIHSVVHDNRLVRVRTRNNNDILQKTNGSAMSFFGPTAEIEEIREWIEERSGAHVNGPPMECQTDDWLGSTPTPILEWRSNRTVDLYATEEVLLIGYGSHVCVRFRHAYLT